MSLEKHYGALTSGERLRLFLAATGRGDEAETRRVLAASAWLPRSAVDFYGEVDALQAVALLHLITQQDLLLSVLLTRERWLTPGEAEAFAAARGAARSFLANRDAWREVVADYRFPEVGLRSAYHTLAPAFDLLDSSDFVETLADFGDADERGARVASARRWFEAAIAAHIAQASPA